MADTRSLSEVNLCDEHLCVGGRFVCQRTILLLPATHGETCALNEADWRVKEEQSDCEHQIPRRRDLSEQKE